MRRHLLSLFLTQLKQNPKVVFYIYRFYNLVFAQILTVHMGHFSRKLCKVLFLLMASQKYLPHGLWGLECRPLSLVPVI